ncbi:uncharacterized protein BDZ83DRAFT_750560 [Colletotrichum acutatum]|uniref:Fungal N-terminal domain-containing protein n=1 Tax=Glomerella acutata TaxID=27357 RepID=A0AAD8XHS5_GLOAC|nr:uncharacterized protein BDZ83DRAFT_750560 [Colletotrichum acutatum]KAK1726841.1 hypothetical protein BDZ83DRAFT_750560 [Colletotrichum acutatum]
MEAIGAAASGIALGQLCIGISKAVHLWHSIEDLPVDIQDAVDRLEALGPVLEDMFTMISSSEEDYGGPDPSLQVPARHAKACIAYATKAHHALKDMVEKLKTATHKPPKASIHGRAKRKMRLAWAGLKRDDVVKLERRLDSAVGMVLMCVGSYERAMIQASHDRIAEKMAAKVVKSQRKLHEVSEERIAQKVSHEVSEQLEKLAKQLQAPESCRDKEEESPKYVIIRSKAAWMGAKLPSYQPTARGQLATVCSREQSEWGLSVQFPAWISRAVWQIQISWSMTGGWQQSLRSFSVRPRDSDIFVAVGRGNVTSMMAMFSKGDASPLDRDENGGSLLYVSSEAPAFNVFWKVNIASQYATFREQLEVCRTLLDLGLEDLIDDDGGSNESPLGSLVESRKNLAYQSDDNHLNLVSLFQSRSANVPTLNMERMFDFKNDNSHSDDWLRIFQDQFLPGYHQLPLRERAEAVRLGAFIVLSHDTYRHLLREDDRVLVTAEEISGSAEVGFSLVHSDAIAMGKRFADEMSYGERLRCEDDNDQVSENEDDEEESKEKRRRTMPRFHPYNDTWSHSVSETLRAADRIHLHRVETIIPLEGYRVPVWTGTPLLSVIGGTLCRISPIVPWNEWDDVFRRVLRQWLRAIRDAGIDLLQYGIDEMRTLDSATAADLRGAFGAEAMVASRRHVRNPLKRRESWMRAVDREHSRNDLYWIPVRVIGLRYGSRLDDWRLWWAPEFEVFAADFWALVDRPRPVMPGSWVES